MSNSMRFVTDLSKGVLGQPDSEELWAEIIAHIPDEVLLKPGVRILSVACGHCTETRLIAKRMLALGISKEAVRDSIWLIDKYQQFTNDAVVRYGFKNVVQKDFLTWEPGMKFDVVVGNPPFQDTHRSGNPLWPLFTKKGFEVVSEDGYVGLITPGRWVLPGHNIKESKIRVWDEYVAKYNPIVVNLGECSRYFSVGSSDDYFSYFVVQKCLNSSQSLTTVTTPAGQFKIRLSAVSWLPYRNCTLTAIEILNKIASKKHDSFQLVWKYDRSHTSLSEVKLDSHQVPVFVGSKTAMFSDHQSELHTNPKVLFKLGRFISYPNRVFIDTVGNISYNSAYVAEIDSGEDVSYLLSDLYIFVALCLFNGSEITAAGYRMLPRLPKRSWTDAELYAHFGLTEEEIAYVKANVK